MENNLNKKPCGKCVYCGSDIEHIGYPDDWKPSMENICYVCDFLIALGSIPPTMGLSEPNERFV